MTTSKSLGRKSLLAFATNIMVSVFGLIALIFVKRVYGYEVLGMLAFALAYAQAFNFVSDLGFGNAHQKIYNDKKIDKGVANGTLITVKVILSTITLLILILGFTFYEQFSNNDVGNDIFRIIIVLTIFKVYIDNLSMIFKNIFAAKIEKAKSTIPKLSGRFIQLLLKLSFLFFGFSAIYMVWAEIFSAVIILLTLVYLFRNDSVNFTNLEYVKKYSKFAIPVMFVGLIGSLTQNIDRILLQYFEGSIEVGIYALPSRITLIILGISLAVSAILFPLFSKYYSQNRLDQINELCYKSVKHVSIVALPLILFLIIFSEMILLALFGEDAYLSSLQFQILLVSSFVYTITAPYSIQILSTGFLRFSFYLNIFILFFNFILNMIFIPDSLYGYEMMGLASVGASLTTLIAFSLRAIICFYIANVITEAKFYFNLWKHIFSASLTGLLLNTISNQISFSVYYLPFIFVLTYFTFICVMFILGEITRKDIDKYLSIINPREMYRYISSELRN